MIIMAMVFSGMFAVNNPEYVDAVRKNRDDGMHWSYVGVQSPNDNEPHISAFIDGKPIILFKMEK